MQFLTPIAVVRSITMRPDPEQSWLRLRVFVMIRSTGPVIGFTMVVSRVWNWYSSIGVQQRPESPSNAIFPGEAPATRP